MKYIKLCCLLILSNVLPRSYHAWCAVTAGDAELRLLLNYEPCETPSPSVTVFVPEDEKRLIYLATEHINDPWHPIAAEIARIMEVEKPDFCVLEGFDALEGVNAPRIVELAKKMVAEGKFAENLYTVSLCKYYGVDFIGGDPREAIYLKPLAKLGFSEKDVVFTLLAQNFPYWNRDDRTSTSPLKVLVENMIREMA